MDQVQHMKCKDDLARIENLLYESPVEWSDWNFKALTEMKSQLLQDKPLSNDQQKKLKELELIDENN